MRRPFTSSLAALSLVLSCAHLSAAPQKDDACAQVLILGSQTVDPDGPYARNMHDWMSRFVKVLTVQGSVPAANVRVLAAAESPDAEPPVAKSTLENVRAAFEKLGRELRSKDQFILFIVGHGTVTEPVGKLCLPGRDLKATELADLLDALPTRKVVVINCASGGAEFLEKYSRRGRVVVSACGVTGEGNQTYFAEFFLLACETKQADANGDGVITVLEAFNRAAHRCINWYHRQYKIAKEEGEDPLPREIEVRTKEARRIFRKFYGGVKEVRMVEPTDGDDEEEGKDPDSENLEDLASRRESGEHAALEDRGENTGALHWLGNKHQILSGKPGEQGEIAARTVLGSPGLLPPHKSLSR